MNTRALAVVKTALMWFGCLLLIPITLGVILLLINAFDEDLKPEVRAFADFSSEQVAPEQNGYFAVMGHAAAIGDDPHRKGIEVVAEHRRRVEESNGADPTIPEVRNDVLGANKLEFQGKTSELCERNVARCLPVYRQKVRAIEAMLTNNRVLVERYRRLYDYPHYREAVNESWHLLLSTDDSNSYAVVRAQIGLQASDGQVAAALTALRRDMQYQRLVLREGRMLITKMIAVSRIKRNLQLLSEIIAVGPVTNDDARAIRETLAPLTDAELDFERVMRSEFAFFKNTIESDIWQTLAAQPEQNQLGNFIARPFIKVNATNNKAYAHRRFLADLSRLPSREFIKRVPAFQQGLVEDVFQWSTVYNPLGKMILAIAEPDFSHYLGRLRNLDALMRLVSLQWIAKERRVSDARMPHFLAQADRALTNPYTGEAAQWDATGRSLYFMGLREKYDPDILGTKLEVFVRPN